MLSVITLRLWNAIFLNFLPFLINKSPLYSYFIFHSTIAYVFYILFLALCIIFCFMYVSFVFFLPVSVLTPSMSWRGELPGRVCSSYWVWLSQMSHQVRHCWYVFLHFPSLDPWGHVPSILSIQEPVTSLRKQVVSAPCYPASPLISLGLLVGS